MLFHVKLYLLPLVLVASAVEDGHLLLVFFFCDFIEGDLIKVFEEPGAGGGVASFGAEDVHTRDSHAS